MPSRGTFRVPCRCVTQSFHFRCTLPYGDNHAKTLKEKYGTADDGPCCRMHNGTASDTALMSRLAGIQKIPTLVVLNENGDVVSTTGKADVEVPRYPCLRMHALPSPSRPPLFLRPLCSLCRVYHCFLPHVCLYLRPG